MYVYVFMCVSVCIYTYICGFLCLCVCVSVCIIRWPDTYSNNSATQFSLNNADNRIRRAQTYIHIHMHIHIRLRAHICIICFNGSENAKLRTRRKASTYK